MNVILAPPPLCTGDAAVLQPEADTAPEAAMHEAGEMQHQHIMLGVFNHSLRCLFFSFCGAARCSMPGEARLLQ